jgi:ABC-type polar amino acid transport system ATPase subunit
MSRASYWHPDHSRRVAKARERYAQRAAEKVGLGPTLSGNTSIIRPLAGLDKPTKAGVLADGKDVTGIDVRQRSVAMVYQQKDAWKAALLRRFRSLAQRRVVGISLGAATIERRLVPRGERRAALQPLDEVGV